MRKHRLVSPSRDVLRLRVTPVIAVSESHTCHCCVPSHALIPVGRAARSKLSRRAFPDEGSSRSDSWKATSRSTLRARRPHGKPDEPTTSLIRGPGCANRSQVLKRKTEEAEAARRRLKEITARQAATTRPVSARATEDGPECQPNSMAPLLRDERSRQEWLESELDTMLRWKEIRRVLEGETAQRAALGQTLHQKRQVISSGPVEAAPNADKHAGDAPCKRRGYVAHCWDTWGRRAVHQGSTVVWLSLWSCPSG